MKKIIIILYFSILGLAKDSFAQNVGIGTTTPNAKAALEIKATDKGVLFPRLTSVQRNAITNPPNGLHIFNTDEHCLNYYDSVYQFWNCYCDSCQTVVITITGNMCKVNFYDLYAKGSPAKKYLVNILAGVTISGCSPGDTALSFNAMPFNAVITINNYGTIEGGGGVGGNGTVYPGCMPFPRSATPGQNGGYAISTKTGILINVNNYGIVAGGGGGGGGSGGVSSDQSLGYGGGGGGGAGIVVGPGGLGGGFFTSSPPPFPACQGAVSYQGQNGTIGQATSGGPGGAGAGGGFSGGNGGGRGQAGQNGAGYLSGLAIGGLAGKAIGGGASNSIVNISSGQSFGVVD